ncbi:MAG: S41 family peptidase [Planctomycetota bacterium]
MKISQLLAVVGGLAAASAAPALAQDANPGMFRYPDVSSTEIVFSYANDLWVVSRSGGTARPLASPPGQETFPKFNADGTEVAFIGNYDGDRDLYTVATMGGIPHRVTHHPGNERLNDWSATHGLLFSYNAQSGNPAQQQIFAVSPEGGMPEAMPIPYGAVGAISGDGNWLAYTPNSRDFRTWKRYRGGLATDIWLYNLDDNSARQATDWEGTDTSPMWHAGVLYYLSDQGDEERLNIWSYNPQTDERRQITRFGNRDVKFPSIGPGPNGRGEIVFQLGSQIYLLNLSNENTTAVDISVPGARATLRDKNVDAARNFNAGGVSSTGKRAVVEARGDIFTVPAENGPPRQLTNTSGAAERMPAWSPSGKWIAYFSDEDGEYELYITQSDGKGETRQLTDGNKTYWMNSIWSPDSKTIYLVDKAGKMYLVDVKTGDIKHFDTEPWANQPSVSWSHDSKWLAYSSQSETGMTSAIHLYDIENDEIHQVTSGFFNDSSPAFSTTGDYLFYQSNRDFTSPDYEDVGSTFVYAETGKLIAVPLNSEVENTALLETDEETWEEEEEETEEETTDEEDPSDDAEDESEDAEDESGDDEAEESEEEAEDNFDREHPLWGVWEGSAKGFAVLGMPQDEVPFTLTIVVDNEGNISGRSESMGESDDIDGEVTFNRDTNEYYSESNEQGMTVIQRGTLTGETMSGTWELVQLGISGTWSASRTSTEVPDDLLDAAGESDEDGDDEPLEIDLEDFEARGFELNVGSGNFALLSSNDKGNLIYLRTNGSAPSLKLYDIEADEPGEKTVLGVCLGYELSGDRKKLGALTPSGWVIVDAKAGQSGKPINLALRKTVNLREEWKQIVTDAWRRHRDFFYVENMHGVDWDAVLDQYLPLVDDAVSREDVSYIIGEMIGELNVGHAYYWGGDTEGQPSRNVGMLGADYAVGSITDPDGNTHNGFVIETIYEGAAWDTDARNPLNAHGLDVSEGDLITHVNSRPVDTSKDPWAMFIGTAGQETTITLVSPPSDEPEDPDAEDSDEGEDEDVEHARTITIKPMGSETNLRYRAWIESNRRYVEEASDGRIGYIYVPNTGIQGQNELFRQFYGQMGKQALLIDERWNGGGQIPNRFIELLNRPRTNYWYRRDGKDWPWPYDSHQGPKAMLINGNAGSGGDMFPWLFKHHDIGKLIGTRTWGGLVGISGVPNLIDGGYTAVPNFGFYELDGTWGIEGHGVDPDIKVVANPSQMTDGRDPQLDAGIRHLLEEVQRDPYRPASRPAEPVRTGIGIDEADK